LFFLSGIREVLIVIIAVFFVRIRAHGEPDRVVVSGLRVLAR
jgi:hypothetical protein